MKRTLAISDIHGELKKFEQLLEKVNYNSSVDQLILLGDYVDRGEDSSGVVEKVIQLKENGAVVLKGNHDDMLVRAMNGDKKVWDNWTIRNGGQSTLKSYQYSLSIEQGEIIATVNEHTKSELMEEHKTFLENLDYFYETDDYIFVHGGVHPTTPIQETDPYVLIWIREEFHNGYNGDKTVIFGHTPTNSFHDCSDVYFADNKIIGIDGGAVFGGRLNCLELPSKKVYFVE
ncbi:metallophosphoesterase family protein [Fictibacillus gelatini]|uniref:metallophosphoesterase family protein n=1 Tax=Fictibacillus gelatini TaxID=225985 RepID=UPI0004047406|nr:metallophosphoesterase family protein [Fictibacillus gelatini]